MSTGSSFSKVDELVSLWQYLRNQGREATVEELCQGHPELVEEVARRIEALRAADGSGTTEPSADRTEEDTPRLGAGPDPRRTSASSTAEFDGLQFHAAGGLGEVFRARHVEMDREVALKFLKAERSGDPDGRRRFLREARITGRLEHPGVVPVYALGRDDAGEPCYAMRFIRGITLGEAIRSFHAEDPGDTPPDSSGRVLALRDLLGRFTSACKTVAYAHSRGTIHRDIKPGNVMIGPFGETLVVDWGLARPVGPRQAPGDSGPADGGPTDPTLGAVGTPQYMSPEQAEGRQDEVGPASDVYSLGATLYTLLAGRTPFATSRGPDLFRRLKLGDFPPPREVNPGVHPALDAICRKAMATRPEGRYPSAQDLARDVERWLADEPVSAYREPPPARAARWVRRHRTAVSVAASAVGVASVALAVLAATLTAANQRERDARRLAERRRAEALASFRLAQEAVDDSFVRVSQGRLLDVPGLQPLRRQLMESAGTFYRRFVEERGDDPAVRAELGQTYARLAVITAESGSKPEALEEARRGLAILEPMARAPGSSPKARRESASARALVGRILAGLRQSGPAEAELREAVRAWDALARERPGDPEARVGQAEAGASLGGLYLQDDRVDEAEAALTAALAAVEALGPRPSEPDPASLRARIHHDLGRLRARIARVGPAEADVRRELAAIEPAAAAHPGDLSLRFDLAKARLTLGEFCRYLGREPEATDRIRDGLAAMERLARENPTVDAYQSEVGLVVADLGRHDLRFGRRAVAVEEVGRALGLFEALVADHPEVPGYRASLAAVLDLMAHLHAESGRPDLAAPSNRRSEEIGRKLAADHADVGSFGDGLRTTLHGGFARPGGEPGGDPAGLGRVVEDARRQARRHPRVIPYRKTLASALNSLGGLHLAAGRAAEAEASWVEAVAEWRAVARAEPEVPGDRFELSRPLSNLAGLMVTLNAFDRARPFAEEGLAAIEPLARAMPDDLEYAVAFGSAAMNAGKVDDNLGDPRRAGRRYDLAIGILEEALRRDGALVKPRTFLGNAHFNRALLRVKAKDPRGAFDEIGRAGDDFPPEVLRDFAGMDAIISVAVSDPATAPPPPIEVGDLGERAAARAVKRLERMRDAGHFRRPGSRAGLMAFPLFGPIRGRDDFRKLVESIEEGPPPAPGPVPNPPGPP